jgi:hypothetical protein
MIDGEDDQSGLYARKIAGCSKVFVNLYEHA